MQNGNVKLNDDMTERAWMAVCNFIGCESVHCAMKRGLLLHEWGVPDT
jgi:hypothetical protein